MSQFPLHTRSQSSSELPVHRKNEKVMSPGLFTSQFEFGVGADHRRDSHQADFQEDEYDPVIGVVGVGYVGIQLVEVFARHYRVLAFDVSKTRLLKVAQELKGLPIKFTSTASDLREAGCILISVPTILKPDKTIDIAHLKKAIDSVATFARPGSTIVMESSVAVGMTRKLLAPLVGLKDFRVGMSPERVDPGRTLPIFEDIPKIISGIDPASMDYIRDIYGRVFKNIVTVSSLETAEMVKLYENCQRTVCAAYANEMADACVKIGIDAWEVSQAAASKPFGYQAYRPGPGIGGHCIPVNPYYLLSTCSMPILQSAAETSWKRPAELANRLMTAIESNKSAWTDPGQSASTRILVVGVGFKRGQSVMSNSPGVAVIVSLMSDGDVYVEWADPLVPAESLSYVPKLDIENNWNAEYLSTFDGIIVTVDQPGLDMTILLKVHEAVVHNYCPQEPELSLTTQFVTSEGAVLRRLSVVGAYS